MTASVKCGCFWSGVLDNEDELRSLWIQYRPQSTGNSAKMLAQLYENFKSRELFEKLDGCFVIVFVKVSSAAYRARSDGRKNVVLYAQAGDGEWLFSDQIKGLFAEGSRMAGRRQPGRFWSLFALGPSHTEGQTFYKEHPGAADEVCAADPRPQRRKACTNTLG